MTKDLKTQVAEWDKLTGVDFRWEAPVMFRAVKQLMAENEAHKETILFLGNENKRLKTTLEGTQTVLAGAMMAFADKQPG